MARGSCGSGNAEPVASAGPIEGGFEVARFVVPGAEGELVNGPLGREQLFSAERDYAGADALEADEGQEVTVGGTEVGGASRRQRFRGVAQLDQ
ncbi:hypothetical protein OG612_00920 [Streptomyces sp. NBC_01527]|uniref:hypothetical protein n=1 Tax=Streptomyces sp. NBC_01527 TaxID=2903894 RepID=UPI00386FEC16